MKAKIFKINNVKVELKNSTAVLECFCPQNKSKAEQNKI